MHAVRSKTPSVLNIFNRLIHDKLGHFKKGVSLSDGSCGEDLDYLCNEAKTAALQKADQIMMTQCKWRQADLDALRLWTMLKDYECRCEGAMMQFANAQKECRRHRDELDTLYKVKELQQCQKEQTEMTQVQMTRQYEQKKTFEEEKARLYESLHIKDSDKKVLLNQLQQMEEDVKLKNKVVYEAFKESGDELLKNIKEFKKSVEKIRQNFEQKQSNLESALDTIQQTIASLEEKNENFTNEINKKIEDLKQQILDFKNHNEIKEQLKLKDSKIDDLNDFIKSRNSPLSENYSLKETDRRSETPTVMNLINRFLHDKRGHFMKGTSLSIGDISRVFSKLTKQIDITSLPKDYILFLNVYGSIVGELFRFCGDIGDSVEDQIHCIIRDQQNFEIRFEDDIKEMKWCWFIASINYYEYYYMNISRAGKGCIYSINYDDKPEYFAENFLEFFRKIL